MLLLATAPLALAAAPVVAPVADAACATPAVLHALAGRAPAPFPEVLVAPPGLGVRRSGSAPPGPGKQVYGTPFTRHLDTANFTINWESGAATDAAAQAAADALEGAWTVFLDEEGWAPPVSSDTYLVWVVLDPSLGGSTGYTTEYVTDEFPEGYPVIYLNPDYAGDAPFWGALAAHEFMHTLQYRVREWQGTDPSESWYWEASATWASELADPDRDGHQYTSAWYADQPGLRYDSQVGFHQYGMFVLNAWLDEWVGTNGMREVWSLGEERQDDTWDTLLAEIGDVSADELWAGFAGAYGNEQLAESDLYTRAAVVGVLEHGASGMLPRLGTAYYRVDADATVQAEGPVVLAGADGAGPVVHVAAGDRLAVTGSEDGAAYTLRVTDPDADTDTDTDIDEDGDTALVDDNDAEDPRGGCGCHGSAGAGSGALGLLALGLLGARRRR
ncbi:MAG: DUF6055 domain-containing protein [Myxococcota bacterium]